MGLKVQWSENAFEQFAEQLERISGFSPSDASRLRLKVDASLRKFGISPEMGQWAPDFDPGFYREILVNPLRIFSEIRDHTIVITHVYRQCENPSPDTFPQDA
jgi:hypothetical protein